MNTTFSIDRLLYAKIVEVIVKVILAVHLDLVLDLLFLAAETILHQRTHSTEDQVYLVLTAVIALVIPAVMLLLIVQMNPSTEMTLVFIVLASMWWKTPVLLFSTSLESKFQRVQQHWSSTWLKSKRI